MADQEKPTQSSASQSQTGPSQAPPPPPGYTYGWVQTPQAPAQQTAQPTGGMPDWAKSKKTLFIVLGVLGFFLLSNVLEKPQQPQTKKPANPAAGTRLTSKEQIDATAKANQEAARLEKNNGELRKRQEQATGNSTGGTTTTAGTTTNAGSTGGGSGQPSETQKMLDQIRAERLKQQYTSLWTSPIAATWEPPQTTLTSSNPAITGTVNAPGAQGNPATAETKATAETDPNNKQFSYDHSTGPYHVIQKGTLIGATLLMDLDGERGGPVVAQIDKDDQVYVKQTDVLLLPEGTTIIGTAQPVSSGSQHLLGVSFDSLVMQDGYALALTKPIPGLSQDGKGGLTGQVDTHWPSKLAWSFAIGAIQGISSGTFGLGSNSNSTVILRAPATDMSQIFQGILNRPNSVKIPAGTRIKIILTDDLGNVPEYANHQMQPGAL
jgi:type IV secretory pathway VirB10-like protein